MASSLPTTFAAVPVNSKSSLTTSQRHLRHTKLFFRPFSKPTLAIFSKGSSNRNAVVKSQLNEVAVDGSSNAAATLATKEEVPASEEKDVTAAPAAAVSEASISKFMTQVSSLVKLIDSRDIVELQLKQLDYELIIRKKEALPQPPAPVVMTHSPFHQAAMPSQFPAPPPASAPAHAGTAPHSASAPSLPPPAAKPKSSHPSLKSPMAGTFYRCSGPGEPPFVKVGDKVKNGQVLCIIEAMKLMNEIEADQSGTVVEILVDDGKPVSLGTPLFVIEP